jgi:hypothetical protein
MEARFRGLSPLPGSGRNMRCYQGWLAPLVHPWLISDHACRRGKAQPGRAGRRSARGGAERDTPGLMLKILAPREGCEANWGRYVLHQRLGRTRFL